MSNLAHPVYYFIQNIHFSYLVNFGITIFSEVIVQHANDTITVFILKIILISVQALKYIESESSFLTTLTLDLILNKPSIYQLLSKCKKYGKYFLCERIEFLTNVYVARQKHFYVLGPN